MSAHLHPLDKPTISGDVKGLLAVSGAITKVPLEAHPRLFGPDYQMMAKPMRDASFWEAFCAVNSPVECLPPSRFVVSPNALDAILRNKFQIRRCFQKALLESGVLEGVGSYGHR